MQGLPARVLGVFFTVFLFLICANPSRALDKSYYDWGPYYRQLQVLGVTISSLEELPAPGVPAGVAFPSASGILPGSPLSPFEHLYENLQLTFTFDPIAKESLRLSIAEERLSEAKTLVEQGKYQEAAEATAAYQKGMETISENMQALVESSPEQAAGLASSLEEATVTHSLVVQSIALSAPPAVATVWEQALSGAERVLDTVADVNGQQPIPDDLSVRIQILKDQGLLTTEESQRVYGLGNRSQVRDELERLATSGRFPVAEIANLDTALSARYPEFHGQVVNVLHYAELRSYEALPLPGDETQKAIEDWRERENKDLPPPPEIRPYLYSLRADVLAREVDLTAFAPEQQQEIVKYYPEAVLENPTAPSPAPLPSPLPTSETPGLSVSEETQVSASPLPSPQPVIVEQAVKPYIAEYTGVLPGDPFYFLKTVGEQAQVFTTFGSQGRAELGLRFAEERLREAVVLSKDESRSGLYKETLERYHDTMSSATESLVNLEVTKGENERIAEAFENAASRHNIVFEKGLLPVPSDKPQLFTDALQATENVMDASADVLGRAALPPALAERLQDLQAQGLLLPEEVVILTKADSRGEVREKVRDLVELGTFPFADAKKLDEAQAVFSPQEYNQLVEVRKVEELQRLRASQSEFAQTATLRAARADYESRTNALLGNIDPSGIRSEDLAGREDLVRVYQTISANPRPINGGQFGAEATPGAAPSIILPTDAVLTACPFGASFRQFEGCFWDDNGKRVDDYDQYRCTLPGQYWSFVSKACVLATANPSPEDGRPPCPAGYIWSWETKTCATPELGGTPFPTPLPEPEPENDEEREKRAKSCPEGANYQAPQGCVWADSGKPVYDSSQYRCNYNQYYSFTQKTCVPNPPLGSQYPDDSRPVCQEGEYFNWSFGRCLQDPEPYVPTGLADLDFPVPNFVTADSPFYFLKRGFETAQSAVAFTSEARQNLRLVQARERFAEAYDQLERKDEDGFKSSLAEYTSRMQAMFNDLAKDSTLNDQERKDLGEVLASQAVEQNLFLQKATVIASDELDGTISAAVSVTVQGIDRAIDLQGEEPIPTDIKVKIEALPEGMIALDKEQEILAIDNRLEARLKLNELVGQGILSQGDVAVLDEKFVNADPGAQVRVAELRKLDEIVTLQQKAEEIGKVVEKTEDVAKKLDEFKQNFSPGQEVPAEIRPYVRLTRIDEIVSTIRPDAIRLDNFGNRKDLQLAVATLQEEFKPTREALQKVEDFRRNYPGRQLPFEFARTEALSFGLGVRDSAGPCFLPSPPFAPNTPCPPPGAAIPIASYGGPGYIVDEFRPGWPGYAGESPFVGEGGKSLVYGDGPKAASPGACPDGYHWMYDSGGWCMSNSGNYGPSNTFINTYSPLPGYTPYTPYYNTPGAPPTSYGYQGPGQYTTYGPYSPSTYYGPAPTSYTTNPPAGTVPGTGPAPTSPGQCPSGFHWMPPSYNQSGWCMADGGTYTPGGGTGPGGGQVIPGTSCGPGTYWSSWENRCVGGGGYISQPPGENCGPGYYWNGNACFPNVSSTSSYQYGCSPGYYWDGSRCVAGNYTGPGWSDTDARTTTWCQPPSGGCGYNSYWDYGSCSCRGSNTYSGGSGPTGTSCSPPPGGCGSGWFDSSSCSCRAASSEGCYNVSASSCGSGFYWDSSACTCRSSGTSSSSGGGSTSGCPSGYHWMGDNGGWCMSDGAATSSTPSYTPPTSSGPAPTSAPTSSEPAPAPAPSEPAPAPPPPSEPVPAPTTSP